MPMQIRTADDKTKYSDLEIAVGEIQKYADALHNAQKTLNVLTQKYKQNASLNNKELQNLKALRARNPNNTNSNPAQGESYTREEILDRVFETEVSEVGMGPSTNGPFAYLMKNIGQAFGVFPNDATLKQMGTDGRRAVPTKDDSLAREFQYIQQELKKLDSIDYSKMPHDQFMKHFDKQLELMNKSHQIITKQMDSRRQKINQIQTNSVQEDHYDEPASDYEGEMLDNQIAFIKYAADEIRDHVHKGGVFPEWFQNKLSGVHEKIKTLHAYMEGERQQAMEKKRMVSMKDAKDDYFESLERKLNESKGLCKECGKPSYTTLDEEKQKGVDGKVCWKGYKRMGTKQKGGKTVDNCVKIKK
jgi:hypothetical protein